MARAATNSDSFNAVAEPRRRRLGSELSGMVLRLKMEQPSVSKHLRVLRNVGLAQVRRNGMQMFYRTNADAIRPLHEWTKAFEALWQHQLIRRNERAGSLAQEKNMSTGSKATAFIAGEHSGPEGAEQRLKELAIKLPLVAGTQGCLVPTTKPTPSISLIKGGSFAIPSANETC